MAPTIRPLLMEPDLARFLSTEERAYAERLAVPVVEVPRGTFSITEVFTQEHAFGALILDGMVLQHLRLGAQTTLKVGGPGDLVARVPGPGSTLVSDLRMSAVEGTRLAMFGNETLAAFRRWPALAAGFHVRMGEQAERVAVHLAICQLPRVEERLLAVLWWLAESWGRVTSVGTVLPLRLTHDALGALIGARRPTVTLAIGELVERGSIARQDQGWLLVEAPPAAVEPAPPPEDPVILAAQDTPWQSADASGSLDDAAHARLLDQVARLRLQHAEQTRLVSERLAELRSRREAHEQRWGRASRPSAPS